jgi:hypothetical protein
VQEFLNWTIDTIREDKLLGSWLEEKKYEWTPLVAKSLQGIFDYGVSVLIVTDNDRQWFLEYILSNINSNKNNRPYLPFYDFRSCYASVDTLKSDDEVALVKDMLNISFPNGYVFWYIGRSQHVRATLPKVEKHSFLWLLDEERQDSFNLKSSDDALDMKLLQMFRLYNKTISATLFGEISIEA